MLEKIMQSCVESVQIRSIFWSVFSRIRTEYGVFGLIRRDTSYISVFSPNAGKYGPENTPYLNTFHAVNYSTLTHSISQSSLEIIETLNGSFLSK